MASDTSPSPDRRSLRRLLRLRFPSSSSQDQNLLLPTSLPPPLTPSSAVKKKTFSTSAFRSLGCSSSSAAAQVYTPSSAAAAVRSSANWEEKLPCPRRSKHRKKERRVNLSSAAAVADVWCAPGISFVGDDSVDCVVSQREMVGRGARNDLDRNLRERRYYGRRGGNQEQVSSMADSLFSIQASVSESDLMPSEYYRRMRPYYHYAPVELDEAVTARSSSSYFGHDLPATIMLLHHRMLLQGGDLYDRYRDWRLDVDQMTYEELLELGEKIGHVSTGLREEEIERCIKKGKQYSIFDKRFSTEMERKCSICQEEYDTEDETGRLGCGHSYHMHCIRRWLLQKNACPVCKMAVSKA